MAIRIRKTRKGTGSRSSLGVYYLEDTKPFMPHLWLLSSAINNLEQAKEEAAYWRAQKKAGGTGARTEVGK